MNVSWVRYWQYQSADRHANLSTTLDNVLRRQTCLPNSIMLRKFIQIMPTLFSDPKWKLSVERCELEFVYNFLSHHLKIHRLLRGILHAERPNMRYFSSENSLPVGIREENAITINDSIRLPTRLIFRFGGLNCTIVFAIIKSD